MGKKDRIKRDRIKRIKAEVKKEAIKKSESKKPSSTEIDEVLLIAFSPIAPELNVTGDDFSDKKIAAYWESISNTKGGDDFRTLELNGRSFSYDHQNFYKSRYTADEFRNLATRQYLVYTKLLSYARKNRFNKQDTTNLLCHIAAAAALCGNVMLYKQIKKQVPNIDFVSVPGIRINMHISDIANLVSTWQLLEKGTRKYLRNAISIVISSLKKNGRIVWPEKFSKTASSLMFCSSFVTESEFKLFLESFKNQRCTLNDLIQAITTLEDNRSAAPKLFKDDRISRLISAFIDSLNLNAEETKAIWRSQYNYIQKALTLQQYTKLQFLLCEDNFDINQDAKLQDFDCRQLRMPAPELAQEIKDLLQNEKPANHKKLLYFAGIMGDEDLAAIAIRGLMLDADAAKREYSLKIFGSDLLSALASSCFEKVEEAGKRDLQAKREKIFNMLLEEMFINNGQRIAKFDLSGLSATANLLLFKKYGLQALAKGRINAIDLALIKSEDPQYITLLAELLNSNEHQINISKEQIANLKLILIAKGYELEDENEPISLLEAYLNSTELGKQLLADQETNDFKASYVDQNDKSARVSLRSMGIAAAALAGTFGGVIFSPVGGTVSTFIEGALPLMIPSIGIGAAVLVGLTGLIAAKLSGPSKEQILKAQATRRLSGEKPKFTDMVAAQSTAHVSSAASSHSTHVEDSTAISPEERMEMTLISDMGGGSVEEAKTASDLLKKPNDLNFENQLTNSGILLAKAAADSIYQDSNITRDHFLKQLIFFDREGNNDKNLVVKSAVDEALYYKKPSHLFVADGGHWVLISYIPTNDGKVVAQYFNSFPRYELGTAHFETAHPSIAEPKVRQDLHMKERQIGNVCGMFCATIAATVDAKFSSLKSEHIAITAAEFTAEKIDEFSSAKGLCYSSHTESNDRSEVAQEVQTILISKFENETEQIEEVINQITTPEPTSHPEPTRSR